MIDLRRYKHASLKQLTERVGVKMFRVLVIGGTGAGKSSTINAIFGKENANIGYGVDPETSRLKTWYINSRFAFIDTPGLGDDVLKDKKHIKSISKAMQRRQINAVLIILEGNTRDKGTLYQIVTELKSKLKQYPLLVAINKADIAMSGRYWSNDKNEPEERLIEFLDLKSESVQRRIKETTGFKIKKPVCYSADKNWNLTALLDNLFKCFK